jgi:hypothetical protein
MVPVYHGVFGDSDVMLSPLNPDIGIGTKLAIPISSANAR